ncbi:MAG: hypothetical protein KBC16_01600 [Candidatus Pacebacteria bacterium]|nr:hypothetical protein [Candidatus Paceibacterota bacterium]
MTQSQEARFDFPGFNLVKTQDNDRHQVEVGTIEDGDHVFTVTMIRSQQHQFLPFAISTVADKDGKKIWTFQGAKHDGVGLLAYAGDVPVIALITRGKDPIVERVIPLTSLVSNKPVGLRELIKGKMGAAIDLDCRYRLTEDEGKVVKIDEGRMHAEMVRKDREASERRNSARDAEKIRRQEEARAQEAEREKRVALIMIREIVTGYTALGERRYGTPVLEAEWQSLPNGTFAILVDAIGEDGKVGKLLESFKIVKQAGRQPMKVMTSQLAARQEGPTEIPEELQPTGTVLVEIKDDFFNVGLYASKDLINRAWKAGLNGGAYVAVDDRDADGKLVVFTVTKETGAKKVGSFIPLG